MALRNELVTPRGQVFPDQYIRVQRVSTSKTEMSIELGFFDLREGPEEGDIPHWVEEEYSVPYDVHGPNPFIQAYEWLKQNTQQSAIDA